MTAADPPGEDRPSAAVAGGAEASDDAPRLRDVVRRLLTPARAGFYLGRDDLVRLGAALGYPLPALDRRIMLEHLFVAAGPAGLVPRLLDLLVAEADTWIAEYRAWEAEYPRTAAIWGEWRARAETLRAELAALAVEAEAAAGTSHLP